MPTAEEALSAMGSKYKQAPRILRFQPPDGTYLSTIETVDMQMFHFSNDPTPGVQIVGRLLDGDYAGKRHSLGIFTEKNLGMLGTLVEEIFGGPEVDNPKAAAEFLQGHVGAVVQVQVATTTKGYTNANITAVLPSDEVADDAAAES